MAKETKKTVDTLEMYEKLSSPIETIASDNPRKDNYNQIVRSTLHSLKQCRAKVHNAYNSVKFKRPSKRKNKKQLAKILAALEKIETDDSELVGLISETKKDVISETNHSSDDTLKKQVSENQHVLCEQIYDFITDQIAYVKVSLKRELSDLEKAKVVEDYQEGLKRMRTFLLDENVKQFVNGQHHEELTDPELNKKNNRDRLVAFLRTPILKGGMITLATLWYMNISNSFYNDRYTSVYETKDTIERKTGKELGEEFMKEIKKISFTTDEAMDSINKQESFDTLLEYFMEIIKEDNAQVKFINDETEKLKQKMFNDIVSELAKGDLTLNDLDISQKDLDAVLDELAARRVIYLYARYFESDVYKDLRFKNKIVLHIYVTGGKPMWAAKIQQDIVMGIKGVVEKKSIRFANYIKDVSEELVTKYRDEQKEEMVESIKRVEVGSFLKNFLAYSVTHPQILFGLGLVGTATLILGFVRLIPGSKYPFRIARIPVRLAGKRAVTFLIDKSKDDIYTLTRRQRP